LQNSNVSDIEPTFSRKIEIKAARMLKAQRAGPERPWFGLGMFGVVGWSVTVPTLLGAFLGLWLDRHHPGPHSWTLALLVAGLVLGCANAWRWISAQNTAIHPEPTDEL
jgi:ATP synthase protein I